MTPALPETMKHRALGALLGLAVCVGCRDRKQEVEPAPPAAVSAAPAARPTFASTIASCGVGSESPGVQKLVTRTALKPARRSSPISSSESAAIGLRTRSSAAPKTTDDPPACAAAGSTSAAANAAKTRFTPWLR